MMKDLLTVKEVAEIANVSTQYVYKLIKDKLQTYVVEVDNQKLLRSDVISGYFNAELQTVANKIEDQLQTNDKQFATVANHENSDFITYLKDEIQNKNKQLDYKDEIIRNKEEVIKDKDHQIEELTNTITELSTRIADLFENSQQLQQNQQLLEATTIRTEESEETEQKEKKGFFKRIFNKK